MCIRDSGEAIESLPLATTGMTGTVDYALVVDPPTGITIDPVTGVIAGTPATTPDPTEWLVSVTSSTGQIGSAQVYVNKPIPTPTPTPTPKPLPDTGSSAETNAGVGIAGVALVGIGAVAVLMARRPRRTQR